MAKKIRVDTCRDCKHCKEVGDRFGGPNWFICRDVVKEVDPNKIDEECELEDY